MLRSLPSSAADRARKHPVDADGGGDGGGDGGEAEGDEGKGGERTSITTSVSNGGGVGRPSPEGSVGDEVDVLSMAVRRPSIVNVNEGGARHVRHSTMENLVSAPSSIAGRSMMNGVMNGVMDDLDYLAIP